MYLDPGFGSMLIQIIVAAAAAFGAIFFAFRQRISAFFSRSKTGQAQNIEAEIPDKDAAQ